ncbi:DNA polymerase III subunit delta' [uncultured Sphingomonas sp.]|uniref:DNA polymerase III subunit delta' n=1 Tax=uncultured Sphingomonas sp. TaxID=158754 RepID=UPI0025E22751|nr:DNA polymerase III subunit delta' [uncultured Sphingomonas sp.]
MSLYGQDRAVAAFTAARDSGTLHHAWLLTGPRGVGKARFADLASLRLLAEAAGPAVTLPSLATPEDHPIAALIAAGSHPDFRRLEREPNDKGDLRRNITIAQVRKLGDLFALAPALSPWRAVVIDCVDDLEPNAANALLKMLEEPPANSIFFLVSHAPGRLLPTIRSRCRRVDLARLDDAAMTSALAEVLPDVPEHKRDKLAALANGSVGRALAFAELDLAPLEAEAAAIMQDGDPRNLRRSKLAGALALKAAAPRYLAFLELAPALIAREAKVHEGARRQRALDAYAKARETAAMAPRLSLDPAAATFQMGNILASVAATTGDG